MSRRTRSGWSWSRNQDEYRLSWLAQKGAQLNGGSAQCNLKSRAFSADFWEPDRGRQNAELLPDEILAGGLAARREPVRCCARVARATDHPILTAWSRVLERRASEPAILNAEGRELRTFSDVEDNAAGFAEAFSRVADRSVVAVQVGNSASLPGILLALWRKECVPVLLDRSMEGAARDSALATCGAAALVSIPPMAGGDRDTCFSVDDLEGPRHAIEADFLKLTSGTTSAARAIRFTAPQLIADCNAVCDSMGITERDLNYGVIPWSHSYGFSNLVTPLLCRGVAVVATEDRFPRAILNGLATSKATVFPGVPVFYQKLVDLGGERPPHLRLCISAGAPLSEATATAFRAQFGLKVHGFYGSSECGGIAYDRSEDDVPEGCVGEPMEGVELRHDETTGRIEVRGAAVGTDYFPDSDPEVLGGGRFAPGDLLRKTAHGYVIAGRVSDFINVAGRKLNPAHVEQILRECPAVRDAVVFAVPHPTRGEEPVACVVGAVSAPELQAHCATRLAPWQAPRDIWLVDALPLNERGKYSRRSLAELYLEKQRAPQSE